MTATTGYGLWGVAALNAAMFILFALSFGGRPRTRRDWRSFGGFAAFVVALFVEMYGFPLTLYLMAGWLQARFPGLDPLSHDAGHLWWSLLGRGGNPHLDPVHLASNALLVAGFVLVASAWRVLHAAQREGRLACTGPYARVRHPQYVGFILVLSGFLLQWPTLLTLVMFPVLVAMYGRLARREERDARTAFGPAWDEWAARTPRYLPRLWPRTAPAA